MRVLSILAVLLSVLVLSACGQNGRYSATLIPEGAHTLKEGETIDGELLVMGGRTNLEEGSRVTGSLYMMGGTVDVNGEIGGDLSMIEGKLALGPRAQVGGDLDVGGGDIARSPEARIGGEVNAGTASGVRVPFFPQWTVAPTSTDKSVADIVSDLLLNAATLAGLAFLAVRLRPRPVARVARAIVEAPMTTGALGLLAMITSPALLVLMAFTIILIPLTLLGALFMGALVAYGWICIGLLVGRRLVQVLQRGLRPATQALLGTSVLTLAVNGVGFIPVLGTVVLLAAASLGLGALFLTRFGLREYVPATKAYDRHPRQMP